MFRLRIEVFKSIGFLHWNRYWCPFVLEGGATVGEFTCGWIRLSAGTWVQTCNTRLISWLERICQ
ncbi:hypothetical protein BOCO_0378 [Bombiscardovia coagulans]|uniref:Uncharacterized protein n=1 Tax=Bombiscardovia coagulans TaxID=686666 RepID=A0A261ESM8_9BIFI|nr:hypothetical protein BOCO_0378 [Bombiscardovia coagulans]